MKMKLTAFILMLLLSVLCTNAQNSFRAIRWDIDDGLSNGLINDMLKDTNGFLWIATESGLNRFDGNTFKNYFIDIHNSPSPIYTPAKKLIEDSLHNIWIGTTQGLLRYDLKADTLSRFLPAPQFKHQDFLPFTSTHNEVYCIEGFSQIITYNVYTQKKKILLKLSPEDVVCDGEAVLYTCFDSVSNSLWMLEGSYEKPGGGLYQISIGTGKRKHYSWPCYRNINGHSHWSEAMRYDKKRNSFWINSPDGLVEFTLNDKQFHRIDAMNKFISLKGYDRFVGLDIDSHGKIWFSTEPKGILVYDPYQQTINVPFSNDSLLQKNVSESNACLYCDRQNMVWSGFWRSKGLYQIIPFSGAVQQYIGDGTVGSLPPSGIGNCVNAGNGNIWMGALGGLIIFDTKTEKFSGFRTKDLPGYKGYQIFPAGIDTIAKKAWLQSEKGIFEMDIATRRCKDIIFKDANLNIIQHPAIAGPLWYGGYGQLKNGCVIPAHINDKLSLFAVTSNSTIAHQIITENSFYYQGTSVLMDKYIFLQTLDGFTTTYINTNGTWAKINTAMDGIKRKRIFYSCLDSSFWIGSHSQLIHFNKDLKLVKSYSQKEGLPKTEMLSFTADNDGNIWFTTQRTISELHIATGKVSTLSEVDGFKKQTFSNDAYAFKDASGAIYFMSGIAGNQGFARIKPGKINFEYPPSIAYIQSIELNQNVVPLNKVVNDQGILSLRYFENNISIKTGVVDYYTKGDNIIRYKLEGLYNNWQYAPANYVIRYNGLSHRQYKLIIQASNAAGEFNGPVKNILINIKPPFWNTWWFYLLISTAIAIAIYKMFQFRLHQKLKVFNVRQKLHRDLHDDVGATLSSIKVYSEILEATPGDHVITNLIKNNAVEMIDKLEIIAWATNPLHDSFKSFKEMLTKNTTSICHAKNIELNIQVEEVDDNLVMPGDIRQNLTLICKECINNVIKHSGASNCDINIFIKNRRFLIVIIDDGKGFYETPKPAGNGIENMQKRIAELQGKINIQSKPMEGTIITIDLATPFKNARFMG